MFRPNPLNKKVADGGCAIGCWSHLASPIAAEIVALAGYDFLIIDHEHGPGHYLDATSIMQAISATPCASFLRVPWNDAVHLKRALDTGVDGVIIPYVRSAEEACQAVDACFYPPAGTRGMAHVLARASDYGMKMNEYADQLEENLCVTCMVETPDGVRAIPEMAKLERLSMIFIGPFDLSTSMGISGQFEHPEFRSMLSDAEAAVKASGKLLGSIATGVDDAAALRDRGYQFVVASSDLLLLREAALTNLETSRPA
ncbi:MAG: 2,4-dihydroxyhept-2-ene-1,7-dioic acid aldolase [Thiotrichales bacterium]|nr:2,4-dihydroxyhept-2-ene-1,7-dioic acid aldolase [Thiotrichales bacterium]|tara:strand:+ start:78 stop:848 length:771 start_codon:yes stop_codon:yes gene_type:complete